MSDGILSQEEIDALLKGDSRSDSGASASGSSNGSAITDIEKDALGEIGNITMGTSATTLSTLLGAKVRITTPKVRVTNRGDLHAEYPMPYVVVEVAYTEGLSGSNLLIIKKEDASVIADLMMGGSGATDRDLDDITISAIGEAMNQMMGSATTSLSSMFDRRIDISPPKCTIADLSAEELGTKLGFDYEDIVQIVFRMEIDDLVDSEIMQVIPIDAARVMVANLLGGSVEPEEPAFLNEPPPPPPAAPFNPPTAYAPPQQQMAPVYAEPMYAQPQPVMQAPPMPQQMMPQMAPQQDAWYGQGGMSFVDNSGAGVKKGQIPVQPVQFMNLNTASQYQEPRNIDLILDVPLDIAVELGKTKKSIKEILELGNGSIIQLDKLAGEPVDLLVNGKLIAKGEVVVIDEAYGIRITTIISPMDRMTKLQ